MEKASNEIAIASVVGQVVDHCLHCGPTGNYLSRNFGPLEKAKFQLYLARPLIPAFADDFNKVVDALAQIQSQVASFPDRKNLIEIDGKSKILRFTQNIFFKRVCFIGHSQFIVPDCCAFLQPHKIAEPSDVSVESLQDHAEDGRNARSSLSALCSIFFCR